jgi:NADPH:quinone reductase-like Zn-dependent oxidoreductase
MRAWQLDRFGLEHLALVERPAAPLASDEVRLRVTAVALNYRDLLVAGGSFLPNLEMPFTPCSDAAGVVVEVGAAVTQFKVGDRASTFYRQRWFDGVPGPEELGNSLGGPRQGVLAAELVLPQTGLVHSPAHLNDAEASTLPIAALTAWFALVNDGPLLPGQTVLVQGTGGVSLIAAQLAHAWGARVIATSSSNEKLARLQALVPCQGINYLEHPEWQREALRLTSGQGADHILEVVGGANLARSIEALAIGGHIQLIGFLEAATAALPIPALMRKRGRLQGAWVGHQRAQVEMNHFLEAHAIHPVVDHIYPFEDAAAAFEHLARGAFGKIVIA